MPLSPVAGIFGVCVGVFVYSQVQPSLREGVFVGAVGVADTLRVGVTLGVFVICGVELGVFEISGVKVGVQDG